MTEVFIGLGSNVGDRLRWIRRAVEALRGAEGIEVTEVSQVYETLAVGPPQPDFLNAVVAIECELSPHELLEMVKGIESQLGRSPGERWGPREIDLDILLSGDGSVDMPELQVPHPRLTSRAFALLPLLEIAPDAELPDGTRLDSFPVAASGVRHFATLDD